MWIEFNRIGQRFEYELRWLHVSPCSRKNTEKGQAPTRSFAHEVLAGRCRTKVCRTTGLELLVYV